jgi:hypothetical protein
MLAIVTHRVWPIDLRIAHRRAEPGWRAAVLDERASLRASEEGSG